VGGPGFSVAAGLPRHCLQRLLPALPPIRKQRFSDERAGTAVGDGVHNSSVR